MRGFNYVEILGRENDIEHNMIISNSNCDCNCKLCVCGEHRIFNICGLIATKCSGCNKIAFWLQQNKILVVTKFSIQKKTDFMVKIAIVTT